MRRIFIFVLFLTALSIALTVGISAAEPTFDTPAKPIPGMGQCHIFGDEHNYSTEHKDGWYESSTSGNPNNTSFARVKLIYTKDGSTHTVTYPSYYILENRSTLTWSFAKVSAYLGVELNVGNIAEIEIPYGITEIPEKAFVLPGAFDETVTEEHPMGLVGDPNEALTYVKIPNTLLVIGDFAFAHCENMATFASNHSQNGATGDHNHQMVQSIGYRAFHNCALLTEFNFNNHLNFLGEACFEGCSLKRIDLTKCIELRIIPANCFHESDAGTVSEILLPNSIVEICDNAFTGASANHVFLGTSLEIIGHNAIVMSDVDVLILPATIKTLYEDSISFGNKSYSPIIAGAYSREDVEKLFDILSAAGISLKQMNNLEKVYSDTVDFFANTENPFCITYLGGHTINHMSDSITSVVYPNGIGHQGYATGSCAVCQQALSEQVQLSPILVAKGYSICTFNNYYAFSNGFEIYHDALEIYERIYGHCDIGILFMLSDNYVSGSDLYGNITSTGLLFSESDLSAANGLLSYTSMDFIMTYSKGLVYDVTDADGTTTTINRGEVPLLISAFLYHSDSTLAKDMYDKSYYLQDTDDICIAGTTADGSYVTVSYDSIYGYVKSAGLE